MPSFIKRLSNDYLSLLSRKRILGLIFPFFLLTALTVSVYTLVTQRMIIEKKAVEEKGSLRPSKPEYVKREILLKLEAPLDPKVKTQRLPINLDKEVVEVDQLQLSSLPPSLQRINDRYKIKEIEKVFKGAGDPKTDVSSFKTRFPHRAMQVKSEAEKIDLLRTYKLVFETDVPVEQLIKELSLSPEIEYAEPNYIFRTKLIPNDPYYLDHYPDDVGSRDPKWNPPYDYQWNLKKINMEQAWDASTGSEEIKIAVVDTGIDCDHLELQGQCLSGYDFVNNDSEPVDDNGHGTFVAGIMTALTNLPSPNNRGIAGISFNSKILPIKVLDNQGGGTNSWVAQGIKFAADGDSRVINLSLGMDRPINKIPETLKAALDYAYNLGSILIAAAGNTNDDITRGYWPGNYDKVIAVGATNVNDNKAPFSNFGSRIDLVAPGTEIISLRAGATDFYCPDNCNKHIIGDIFYRASGTSFSSPTVAGIASLLLAYDSSLSVEELRQKLRIGADDIGQSGVDAESGYGRLNGPGALSIVQPPPVAMILSPSHMLATNQNTIQIVGTANSRDTIEFNLFIGRGAYPIAWNTDGITLTNNGVGPIVESVLGEITTSNLEEGIYTIKLEVKNTANIIAEWRRSIFIDKSLHQGFPFVTGKGIWASPLIADLDDNGARELIFVSDDKNLYVVDQNGGLLPGWPKNLGAAIYASPAVGDLNKDGRKEIVVNTKGRQLFLLDYLGNTLFSATTQNVYNAPVIGHFTQKDEWEVLILGYRGTVEVYNKNGERLIYQQVLDSSDYYILNPAIYDLGKDGLDEIFLMGRTFGQSGLPALTIYKYEGSLQMLTEVKRTPISFCYQQPGSEFLLLAPTIGDIDLDGKTEIVLGCGLSSFLGVWEITEEINLEWKYNFNEYNKVENRFYPWALGTYATLANVDDDEELEIIIGGSLFDASMSESAYGLTVFEHDGEIKEGWPFTFEGRGAFSPPVVTDLDNDGRNEIIAGEGSFLEDVGKKVYALRSNGSLLPGWPKPTNGGIRASAAINDLDDDDKIEIAIGSTDGKLYVWDTEGKAATFYDWPQYLHDERHTASYHFLFGQTIKFNPENIIGQQPAYIEISPSDKTLMKENFTLEVWIKPHAETIYGPNAHNPHFVLAKEGIPNEAWGYSLAIANRKLEFGVNLKREDGSRIREVLLGKTLLREDKWSFVKAIKAGNSLSLFVNGQLESEKETASGAVEKEITLLTIGCAKVRDFPSCLSQFYGEIDEIRISATARVGTEIPVAPFISDQTTIALWHFDSNALDSSPNNLNGEINGRIIFIPSTINPALIPSITPTLSLSTLISTSTFTPTSSPILSPISM